MLKTNIIDNREPGAIVYHNRCYAMGTRLTVVMIEPSGDSDAVFDEMVREVNRLEAKLSRFSERSDVSRINRQAGRQPVRIDAEMENILSMCMDYTERTAGAFDITLPSRKPSMSFHSEGHSSGCSKLSDGVLLDSKCRTVVFSSPEIQIDLGGFGKGYAIQQIESILKNNGVKNALVSFGESSVLAMGRHPYGDCWKIGIEDSRQPGRSVYAFELVDQSISTSGFQRKADGAVRFHIISPRTRRPVEATSSVTVRSSDALEAEILSTAVFASLDADTTFLNQFGNCQVVRIDYSEEQSVEIFTYGKD